MSYSKYLYAYVLHTMVCLLTVHTNFILIPSPTVSAADSLLHVPATSPSTCSAQGAKTLPLSFQVATAIVTNISPLVTCTYFFQRCHLAHRPSYRLSLLPPPPFHTTTMSLRLINPHHQVKPYRQWGQWCSLKTLV